TAWQRYGVSLEATHRWQRAGDLSEGFTRFAIGVDYRVSGGAWVNFTFGRDFGTGIAKEPLIALANLQWNIGLDRGVRPDTVLTRKSEAGAP
ncbi:MAG TPA: hypothetical protein VN914_11960, partial [Polyangia bacterium]|nr:hypothetical protein [Polyangia bacterium]